MLNEWVFDARLMEQQVTGLFILFHTNTTFIDRPTDSVALRDSDHSLVLASSVRPSFVRCCVLCPMFYVPTTLTPSSIVYIVYCSFVVFCVPSVALYILKSGVPFQGYRPIVTYDYSVRTNHVVPRIKGFLRNCPLS